MERPSLLDWNTEDYVNKLEEYVTYLENKEVQPKLNLDLYVSVAKSEGLQFGNSGAEVLFNKTTRTFVICAGETLTFGPLMRNELEAVAHAVEDALELKK